MKRKALALLMVSVLGCMTLSGCGGTDTSSEFKKEEAKTSGSSEASGDNSLTVWAWDQSFNIYAMKEAEKVYQKENPDFTLEVVEVTWDDMQTKLSTIVGSGNYDQLPDILLMQDFAYQKYCITYPDLFLDLTDSGIDFTQFAEGKLNASVVDGKHYGVPFDNGTGHCGSPFAENIPLP